MAGGQATNSGIDYQQRIAAWILINQYAEFDLSIFFDQIDEKHIITKTLFETEKPIDDLNLICDNYNSIYLQIKRSISFSNKTSSEFYKAINQFINEFIKNENSQNLFGLITTSDSSSKITNDLKKIVDSIKLNDDAFFDNPLNKSEKETLEKFEILFNGIYKKLKGISPQKQSFHSFTKRIIIGIIDIQSGHPMEVVSYMLLRSLGFKNPESVWSILIKNSLTYASKRQSIDKKKLERIFDKYKEQEFNVFSKDDQSELLKTEIISQGELPVNKEVILAESPSDNKHLILFESNRFSSDCQTRFTFYENIARNSVGVEFKLIQRFTTIAGFERFVEEESEHFDGKKLVILDSKINYSENDECINLHKRYINNLIDQNENILLCIHCGKPVDTKNTVLVEIDDINTAPAVGVVHKTCRRPIDRILGTMLIPSRNDVNYLDSFDYKLWISLVMKGQGLLAALKQSPQVFEGRTPLIAWNSDVEYDNNYSYCIKFILEDGSSSYSYTRSRIERFNKLEAEKNLEIFERIRKEAKDQNDPRCVLSQSKTEGAYSELLRIKQKDEKILEIISIEITKYSKLIAKVFDSDIFHYAPLCLLRDLETEAFINLSNVVPIISDPLQLEDFVENWKNLGFQLDKIELKIIKSDKDFDNYIRIFIGDGLIPIIDPIFDKRFNLISGYRIKDSSILEKELNEGKD